MKLIKKKEKKKNDGTELKFFFVVDRERNAEGMCWRGKRGVSTQRGVLRGWVATPKEVSVFFKHQHNVKIQDREQLVLAI